jgi:hypothetical protein
VQCKIEFEQKFSFVSKRNGWSVNGASASFGTPGENSAIAAAQIKTLARRLTARRDNLAETIVALQKRLADEKQQTFATVGSEMKLLQPAQLLRRC